MKFHLERARVERETITERERHEWKGVKEVITKANTPALVPYSSSSWKEHDLPGILTIVNLLSSNLGFMVRLTFNYYYIHSTLLRNPSDTSITFVCRIHTHTHTIPGFLYCHCTCLYPSCSFSCSSNFTIISLLILEIPFTHSRPRATNTDFVWIYVSKRYLCRRISILPDTLNKFQTRNTDTLEVVTLKCELLQISSTQIC